MAMPPATRTSFIATAVRCPPAECPATNTRGGAAPSSAAGSIVHAIASRTSATIRPSPPAGARGVLDHSGLVARRQKRFAEERVRLFVVHLPVPAVDIGERRRAGASARDEVEALPRTIAVAQVDLCARSPQDGLASSGPV